MFQLHAVKICVCEGLSFPFKGFAIQVETPISWCWGLTTWMGPLFVYSSFIIQLASVLILHCGRV